MRVRVFATVSLLSLVGVIGCQSPDMIKPTRPMELDRLDKLAGKWHGTWEMKAGNSDEVEKGSGTSNVSWDANRWYLVEHMTGQMGEMGSMEGIGIWAWDDAANKYRTWWFDDWGSTGSGTAKYNESTGTWKVKGTSRHMGHRMVSKGTMTMPDANTMKWEYSEWVPFPFTPWGIFKVMEMEGTSTRQ